MNVATWNVNSIRARLDRALAWLDRQRPDVVCLQELKCVDDAFPQDAVREAGYHAVVHGQKTYNGVAILSRTEPADPLAGLRFHDDDYAWATAELLAAAKHCCSGRLVSTLEGGYDLRALANSAAAHVRALMAA